MISVGPAVVIIRHNTVPAGDVTLALREFESLAGKPGMPIASRRELVAIFDGMAVGHKPEVRKGDGPIAVQWRDLPVTALNRLIQRSAFAQEIIFHGEGTHYQQLMAQACCGPTVSVDELAGRVLVAIAWGYIIESEAALDNSQCVGRIKRTIELLTEPYILDHASVTSQKLRLAKKTTLSLSHDLHIYKAKFFPRMVRALLNIFENGDTILDPFCGSGTALLEASLLGINSVGIDIDPICRAIANTKVSPFLQGESTIAAIDEFRELLAKRPRAKLRFEFPEELSAKLRRRDRIEGTGYHDEIVGEATTLASVLSHMRATGSYTELLSVLCSDAVTKKIRYRFIGIGNGKYTIEVTKQPLLERLSEKLNRAKQLVQVFNELQTVLGLKLGKVAVVDGDARDVSTWKTDRRVGLIVTSPPYLPASSGREHYAASRQLAFAVLGHESNGEGYFDTLDRPSVPNMDLTAYPEASALMDYLLSDENAAADPQRDAMRFQRKAMPTRQYLGDIKNFFKAARSHLTDDGSALFVVAHHHTFYSHRRQALEYVVSGKNLYEQIAKPEGFDCAEEIKLELLKPAASHARPRAKEEYFESVLVCRRSTPNNLRSAQQLRAVMPGPVA